MQGSIMDKLNSDKSINWAVARELLKKAQASKGLKRVSFYADLVLYTACRGERPARYLLTENERAMLRETLKRLEGGMSIPRQLGYDMIRNIKITVSHERDYEAEDTMPLLDTLLSLAGRLATAAPVRLLDLNGGVGLLPVFLKTYMPDIKVTSFERDDNYRIAALSNRESYSFDSWDIKDCNTKLLDIDEGFNIICINANCRPDTDHYTIDEIRQYLEEKLEGKGVIIYFGASIGDSGITKFERYLHEYFFLEYVYKNDVIAGVIAHPSLDTVSAGKAVQRGGKITPRTLPHTPCHGNGMGVNVYGNENIGLNMWHLIVPPSVNLEEHSHPCEEVYYMSSGSGVLSVDGKEVRLNEGDAFYIESGLPHGFSCENAQRCEIVAFSYLKVPAPGKEWTDEDSGGLCDD